jgi:hypothetical protein
MGRGILSPDEIEGQPMEFWVIFGDDGDGGNQANYFDDQRRNAISRHSVTSTNLRRSRHATAGQTEHIHILSSNKQ